MKKIDWKDVWVRSWKTFIEALLTYVAAALSGIKFGDGSLGDTAWIGLIITGGCTAVTAVINGVILPLFRAIPPVDPTDDPDL